MNRFCLSMLGVLLSATSTLLIAQAPQPQPPAQQQAQTSPAPAPGTQPLPPGTETLRPNYVLGPGDQILIRALEMEEISDKPFRVEPDGSIDLPMLGRMPAAGLTIQQLEGKLVDAIKPYVIRPQVTVTVVQFRSEPVFLVGAFKAPGIYPLQGERTLVEMLSAIGGLLPNASRRIKVTRRKEFGPIPLPGATESADGKVSWVMISMGSLRENVNPAEDIVLDPYDVISVERAEMIYVNGEVGKVGGFELDERDSISVAKLVTLAGGVGRDADASKARILRPVMDTSRRAEIPVDLKRVLNGKDSDFPLLPNDLLVVPRSSSFKRNLGRVLLIAIPLAATLSITLALR